MPRRETRSPARAPRAVWLLVVVALVPLLLVLSRASASLEGEVFTSREANVRMVVPRGWRVSDLPTYPGILVWMARTKPPGLMLLTVDTIDTAARCAWPEACRTGGRPLAEQMACALSSRLVGAGFKTGPVQGGRTPWFDYEDGHRWLRQAVLMAGPRAVTLILSTPSAAERATHARSFDRAIRSLRPLTASEAAAAAPAIDAGVPGDAGVLGDGGLALPPAKAEDGGVPSVTATGPEDGGTATRGPLDAGAAPTLPGAAPLDPCPAAPAATAPSRP